MTARDVVRRGGRLAGVGVLLAAAVTVVFLALAAAGRVSSDTPLLGRVAPFLGVPLAAERAVVQRGPAARRPSFAQTLVGFWSPGGPHDGGLVEATEQAIGRRAALLAIGQAFDEPLDTTGLRLAWEHGSLTIVSWYLWSTGYGRHGGSKKPEPAFALRTILAGRHDGYIRRFAAAAAGFRHPFVLRLAPEMNGTWYPWSTDVTGGIPNGNARGQFVSMWRHIHDIFDREHATNVIWDWGPNVVYYGQRHPLADFYPGDRYVDLVGLDGYNWGDVKSWARWSSPEGVFGKSVAALRRITTRPIVLNEVASAETGGDKARWVARFLAYLRANRDIVAFVWFDWRKETDWRFTSSRASREAFAAGLAAPRFTGSPAALVDYLTEPRR